MNYEELMKLAVEARRISYSPYSGFQVGAALLCDDGTVYRGCNMENAAFSSGICAERAAIYKAVSEGKRGFKAIAIAGGSAGEKPASGIGPCGVCRQVMMEFCDPGTFEIVPGTGANDYKVYTLETLLPMGFGPNQLGNQKKVSAEGEIKLPYMTEDTPLVELYRKIGYEEFGRFLFFSNEVNEEWMRNITMKMLEIGLPKGRPIGIASDVFDADLVLHGLNNIIRHINNGIQIMHHVYSSEEEKANKTLESVQMMYFPGDEDKPFVIVCPGGAYLNICTLEEGIPIATWLNDRGYTVFVLNYRVNISPLFPHPMEDLASAVRKILSSDELSGFRKDHYVIYGFSAGAHLAAEWGTNNMGFRKYNLPAPDAIILGYPFIEMALQMEEEKGWFYSLVVGEGWTSEDLDTFSVNYHMDSEYPPTFITTCTNDAVVSYKNTEVMIDALKCHGVQFQTRLGKTAGHGYNLALGTDVEGWMDESVDFFEKIIK